MHSHKVKIDVNDLQPGMYVAELDRPWLDTPFLFQGMWLNSYRDIQTLTQRCDYVYIDPELTREQTPAQTSDRSPRPVKSTISHHDVSPRAPRLPYQDEVPVERELGPAKRTYNQTRRLINHVLADARLGNVVRTQEIRSLVSEMGDSIIRNPDALIWLTHINKKDEYTHIHSMNVCILCMAFARHLGYSRRMLFDIGIGGLLHDVGKMRVPLEVLNKAGSLTPEEYEEVKRHPIYGRDMLEHARHLPPSAAEIAYTHHERADGSGYPRGLRGDQMSHYTKIVSIVDVYDAATSERIYHGHSSPLELLELLYEKRYQYFEPRLVEQFIACLGIYPSGSIVELTTGEVGVVISTDREMRLRPKLMMMLDPEKSPYPKPYLLDLKRETETPSGDRLDVRTVLERGAYGIDVSAAAESELASAQALPQLS